MSERTFKITNGPDKPALQWAVAYPDRERVHFGLENDGLDVQVLRMDELSDGFSFKLEGVVASGSMKGASFQAAYSIEDRGGTLSVAGAT